MTVISWANSSSCKAELLRNMYNAFYSAFFLVQLCGSYPDSMTRCAELLQNEVPINFVDINIGCPIDLVFKQVCKKFPSPKKEMGGPAEVFCIEPLNYCVWILVLKPISSACFKKSLLMLTLVQLDLIIFLSCINPSQRTSWKQSFPAVPCHYRCLKIDRS